MMYWGDHGMNAWGYTLMSVNAVLFWLLLIVGIALLVRYLGQQHPRTPRDTPHLEAAEHILAERFARGELDEDEYRRRLAVVRGEGGPPN